MRMNLSPDVIRLISTAKFQIMKFQAWYNGTREIVIISAAAEWNKSWDNGEKFHGMPMVLKQDGEIRIGDHNDFIGLIFGIWKIFKNQCDVLNGVMGEIWNGAMMDNSNLTKTAIAARLEDENTVIVLWQGRSGFEVLRRLALPHRRILAINGSFERQQNGNGEDYDTERNEADDEIFMLRLLDYDTQRTLMTARLNVVDLDMNSGRFNLPDLHRVVCQQNHGPQRMYDPKYEVKLIKCLFNYIIHSNSNEINGNLDENNENADAHNGIPNDIIENAIENNGNIVENNENLDVNNGIPNRINENAGENNGNADANNSIPNGIIGNGGGTDYRNADENNEDANDSNENADENNENADDTNENANKNNENPNRNNGNADANNAIRNGIIRNANVNNGNAIDNENAEVNNGILNEIVRNAIENNGNAYMNESLNGIIMNANANNGNPNEIIKNTDENHGNEDENNGDADANNGNADANNGNADMDNGNPVVDETRPERTPSR